MDDDTMKVCTKCKCEKNLNEFHKHHKQSSGLNPMCKTCRSENEALRYKANRNLIKKKSAEYYKTNRKEFIKKTTKRTTERSRVDMFFRLQRRLRNRLYYALKNKKWSKHSHFTEYIGCGRDFLIEYLQNKFSKGMNWDNYGKWHIDHIIPLSSARSEKELYELCHYSNLQPLWASDNIKKGNHRK